MDTAEVARSFLGLVGVPHRLYDSHAPLVLSLMLDVASAMLPSSFRPLLLLQLKYIQRARKRRKTENGNLAYGTLDSCGLGPITGPRKEREEGKRERGRESSGAGVSVLDLCLFFLVASPYFPSTTYDTAIILLL